MKARPRLPFPAHGTGVGRPSRVESGHPVQARFAALVIASRTAIEEQAAALFDRDLDVATLVAVLDEASESVLVLPRSELHRQRPEIEAFARTAPPGALAVLCVFADRKCAAGHVVVTRRQLSGGGSA